MFVSVSDAWLVGGRGLVVVVVRVIVMNSVYHLGMSGLAVYR